MKLTKQESNVRVLTCSTCSKKVKVNRYICKEVDDSSYDCNDCRKLKLPAVEEKVGIVNHFKNRKRK